MPSCIVSWLEVIQTVLSYMPNVMSGNDGTLNVTALFIIIIK